MPRQSRACLRSLLRLKKKLSYNWKRQTADSRRQKKRFDTELETWQKQSSELLQKTEQAFSSQNSKQEQAYTELHEKLSSLLPEASAVGIAAAFADEKKSRQNAMWINLLTSYFCIFAIFLIAIFFYQENKDTLSSIIYARNNASEYFVFFSSPSRSC